MILRLFLARYSPRLPAPLLSARQPQAQSRSVTLAEAIRFRQRVQPAVVQAAAAMCGPPMPGGRSAWASYLPTVSASSSASDFFSEGTSRIDPITGQLTGGNSQQSQPQYLPVGQPRPVHRLSPRGRHARGSGRPGSGGRLSDRCPVSAGADHHQSVSRRAGCGPAAAGAREQRAPGRGASSTSRWPSSRPARPPAPTPSAPWSPWATAQLDLITTQAQLARPRQTWPG